ncbi:zinc-dependent alcohol dehydrogenase family protein [Microlunatus spumicola]|uniref:Zinc-dependent alcohol dehydrogenase family protein n=1 Tax=Microlunatus spumicola TaxID=81499 RepID=A0ABP6WZI8_9ACTN
MRAVVLRRPGQPLEVEDVTLAEPGDDEVRVRVEAAGVCHSDLHYVTGDLRGKLPAVIGHEGVGVVERVGRSVTRVAPGDRVVFTWRPRCGDCEFCSSGRPALCVVGRVQGTTGGLPDGTSRLSQGGETVHHLMGVSCFAEACVVSARSLVKIPDDVPAQVAAIVGCAVVTGVGAVLNLMRESTGQPVVVVGAGGVGLSAVLGLQLVSAGRVVVVDTVAARLELAAELGATDVVDASAVDAAAELARMFPGGARWAVDAVGAAGTLELALGSLGPTGTLVALGLGHVDTTFRVPVNLLVQQERRILGSLYGSSNPLVQVPLILDLYRRGRLPLDRLVGRTFGLSEVNEAYAALTGGAVGRATLDPSR